MPKKEPTDFLEWRQSKIVRFANALWRSEIGSQRNQYHEWLAPTGRHGDERSQKRKQEKEILDALAPPLRNLAFMNGPFARAKIDKIDHKKDGHNNRDRQQPLAPAILQCPAKRHAFDKSQDQRRAHGQQRAADVADQKNKERDMHRRDAPSVHRDPRPDQQHRCADGAD